jgi:class 3 adenylate cyclase
VDSRTENVILILADISGYTHYMLANAKVVVHAQMVITKLLEQIIREAEIPLEVKEIEGDSVFIYAVKPQDPAEWDEMRRLIGGKLFGFFKAFERGILWGSEFALCSCPSCQNIDQLKLKIVVHSGEAVFHKVGNFSDVSSVDVILAHRLLKNSNDSNEYILMTDSAYRDIGLVTDIEASQGEEHYEGFGSIRTYTYLTEGMCAPKPATVERFYKDRGKAFGTGLRMLFKGYFGQIQTLLRTGTTLSYRNMKELPLNPLARTVWVLRIILLAPIVIPICFVVQLYRVISRSKASPGKPKT